MTANIIDGKSIAQETIAQIKVSISKNIKQGLNVPGLAVVIVGDNPASLIYVRNKRIACKEAGIKSYDHDLPIDISEEELIKLVQTLNNNPEVHGILVQLPLPDHINETKIIESIDPIKDVDGFHPYTIGRLMQRIPVLRPCTSIGVITMLDSIGVDPVGKHAVIVGASNLVGRPLALELLLRGATTTVCHKFTKDLESFVNQADILAVAVGKANLIPGSWIKKDAIVFDIGINRNKDGKVTGDIDFEAAKEKASWISPVPGGVGPMTVAMLLKNTLIASTINSNNEKRERKISSDKWIKV